MERVVLRGRLLSGRYALTGMSWTSLTPISLSRSDLWSGCFREASLECHG